MKKIAVVMSLVMLAGCQSKEDKELVKIDALEKAVVTTEV